MEANVTHLLVAGDGSSAEFPQDEAEAVDVRLEEGLERFPVDTSVQNLRGHVPTSPNPGVVVADVDGLGVTGEVKTQ